MIVQTVNILKKMLQFSEIPTGNVLHGLSLL